MANLKLDPLVNRVRGKLGNFVYKKLGVTAYIAKSPMVTNRPSSTAQIAHRERFKSAARYAKSVFMDPVAKAVYAAAPGIQSNQLYSFVVTDYLKAPEIKNVDLSAYSGQIGDTIQVRATDNFEVTSVEVQITAANSDVIENGLAVRSATNPEIWVYTAVAVAPGGGQQVTVTASDRPGNATTKVETK